MGRQPTMMDIARHAGVSQRTVSNVVNGSPSVSEATRTRVEESIRLLGYRPNVAAQRLRNGTTGMLGLVVPNLAWPYFAQLAHLIHREATACGYTLVVAETEGSADYERSILAGFSRNLCDGVIVSPLALTGEQLSATNLDLPIVLLGEKIRESEYVHLSIDNVGAAGQMVEHLWGQGGQTFAILGAHDTAITHSAGNLRMTGFLTALRRFGVDVGEVSLLPASPWTMEAGYRAVGEWLASGARADAVLAMNDLLAVGALRACAERGVSVPGDVLLSGWDDIEVARYVVPALTTVAPDVKALAGGAVQALVGLIKGEAPAGRHIDVHCEVIGRASTMRPRVS